MSGGRRSSAPGSASQRHYASSWMSPALYRIARKLPPNPKVVRKEKGCKGGGWNVKVSDEDVISLLARRKQGESLSSLADEAGVSLEVMKHWADGTNRPKCLIEAEKRYAKMLKDGLTANG